MDDSAYRCRPARSHQHLDRRARLVPLLEQHIAEFNGPFSWRRHCAAFCGAWVSKVTGIDPLAGWPECETAMNAARALKAKGFASLIEAVSAALPEIEPAKARIGDIVAREVCGELAIGINMGRKAAFLGRERIEFLLSGVALRAWAVG